MFGLKNIKKAKAMKKKAIKLASKRKLGMMHGVIFASLGCNENGIDLWSPVNKQECQQKLPPSNVCQKTGISYF